MTISTSSLVLPVGAEAQVSANAATDHSDHPRSSGGIPSGPSDGSGQAILLEYACNNRFVISSAYQAPVTVTFAVAAKSETGSVNMAAAPMEEPGLSEAIIDTRNAGTVVI